MSGIANSFVTRGDLAHLALFLWASGASLLLAIALRESSEANHRALALMQEFLAELARFNRRIEGEDP
jgi:hypothetical protein